MCLLFFLLGGGQGMKDIFIFNNGRLKRKDSTIQFIDAEEKKKILPIVQVENIHLLGEIDLNTSFLNLLTNYGVALHIYNYYGYYSGSYVPRSKQVSGFVDVKQASYVLDYEKRMYVAKQFLYGAIHHMMKNLRQHKDVTEVFLDTIESEKTKMEKHFNFLEDEICMLNEEGKKIFIKAYQERLSKTIKHRSLNRQTSYRFLIRLECYKLIKHFIGEKTYKPLKAWW
jgi:CRISPR/Cas system-associated endonuclease Cas1